MLEENIAALGWNELGNLYDWLPGGKKPMVEKGTGILTNLYWIRGQNSSRE
jgi:hypothetical protein